MPQTTALTLVVRGATGDYVTNEALYEHPISVRMTKVLVSAIDEYREAVSKRVGIASITRSQAITALIELGLHKLKDGREGRKARRSRNGEA
jgi:hypothetical protein